MGGVWEVPISFEALHHQKKTTNTLLVIIIAKFAKAISQVLHEILYTQIQVSDLPL